MMPWMKSFMAVALIEAHLEEAGDTTIHTGGIGNEEHEGDDRSRHTQALIRETGAEEVGHRARLDMLRHQLRATT